MHCLTRGIECLVKILGKICVHNTHVMHGACINYTRKGIFRVVDSITPTQPKGLSKIW